MSQGSHAVDGSFRRDAGVRVGRALAIIVVAVVVAVVLLRHNGGSGSSRPPAAAAATTSPPPATTAVPTTPPSTLPPTTVPPTTLPPAQVKVVVANGTTKTGAAGFYKTKLAAKGYDVLAALDATSSSITTSSVYYQAGFKPEAATLAATLGLPTTSIARLAAADPIPATAQTANIVVVVGTNLASQVT